MKTHRFFLTLLLSAITIAGTSRAQTNYTVTRVIQGNGYSYLCDSDGSIVNLYNLTNPFIEVGQLMKDGTDFDDSIDSFGNDWQAGINEAQQLALQTFTAAELESFRSPAKQRFQISLFVNPATERVDEVGFYFDEEHNYAHIPMDRYRQIELAIKQNVTFQISDYGKRLNYCFTAVDFDPGPSPIPPGYMETGLNYVINNDLPCRFQDIRIEVTGMAGGQRYTLISSSPGDLSAGDSRSYAGNTLTLPIGTTFPRLELAVTGTSEESSYDTRITANYAGSNTTTTNFGNMGGNGSTLWLALPPPPSGGTGRHTLEITISED